MGEYFRLVMAEFLKQKRSFLWPVVLATPLLGAFLSFCNLFLRYDYLMGLEANQGLTPWQVLLFQHHFLWAFLLPLVATRKDRGRFFVLFPIPLYNSFAYPCQSAYLPY